MCLDPGYVCFILYTLQSSQLPCEVGIIRPFYQWGKWGVERFSSQPKGIQLGRNRVKTWTQVLLTPKSTLLTSAPTTPLSTILYSRLSKEYDSKIGCSPEHNPDRIYPHQDTCLQEWILARIDLHSVLLKVSFCEAAVQFRISGGEVQLVGCSSWLGESNISWAGPEESLSPSPTFWREHSVVYSKSQFTHLGL